MGNFRELLRRRLKSRDAFYLRHLQSVSPTLIRPGAGVSETATRRPLVFDEGRADRQVRDMRPSSRKTPQRRGVVNENSRAS